jgi:signal peptide peptidase SppA
MNYPNLFSALDGSYWFITDTKAEVIGAVVSKIFSGEVQANMALLAPSKIDIKTTGGVAVVKLHGTMGKHLKSASSGGVSTDEFRATIERLKSDDSVGAVVLDIDSPGGSVHGVEQAAAAVRALRQSKPVYAIANDTMASAAYYIGSAATKVFVQPTSIVGSVGTLAMGMSLSRKLEREGVDVHIVKSGSLKAINNEAEPIDNGRVPHLEKNVNFYNSQFQRAVRLNRPHLTDENMETIATGDTFNADESVQVGLADGIATLDEVIAMAGEDASIGEKFNTLRQEYQKVSAVATTSVAAVAEKEAQIAALQGEIDTLRQADTRRDVEDLVSATITAKGLSPDVKDKYVEMGMKYGMDELQEILAMIPEPTKVPLGPSATLMYEEETEEEGFTQLEVAALANFPSLNRNK